MGERIRVEAYAGYRGDERPRAFSSGERTLQVKDVVDRWYDLDGNYFRVLAGDGRTYLLRHDLNTNDWELMEVTAET